MTERKGRLVKDGWRFTKCDERHGWSHDERFRLWVLESLYIIVDPGGGGIKLPGTVENKERFLRLVDELAVELVGGVPEDWEEFT